jgi:hypothetical protein
MKIKPQPGEPLNQWLKLALTQYALGGVTVAEVAEAWMEVPPKMPANDDTDAILARGAMLQLEEVERVIPRNKADRDYGETVRTHVDSERAFRVSAEARILDLELENARLKVRLGSSPVLQPRSRLTTSEGHPPIEEAKCPE